MKDHLGDDLPSGYKPWMCGVCTAVCNFEAMMQCAKRVDPSSDCGFDKDQPESNGGAFGFMVKMIEEGDTVRRRKGLLGNMDGRGQTGTVLSREELVGGAALIWVQFPDHQETFIEDEYELVSKRSR